VAVWLRDPVSAAAVHDSTPSVVAGEPGREGSAPNRESVMSHSRCKSWMFSVSAVASPEPASGLRPPHERHSIDSAAVVRHKKSQSRMLRPSPLIGIGRPLKMFGRQQRESVVRHLHQASTDRPYLDGEAQISNLQLAQAKSGSGDAFSGIAG